MTGAHRMGNERPSEHGGAALRFTVSPPPSVQPGGRVPLGTGGLEVASGVRKEGRAGLYPPPPSQCIRPAPLQ